MKNFKLIQVSPQGYCGGVLKAIAQAKKARKEHPDVPITILGNLVHNDYVRQALNELSIQTIDHKGMTRLRLLDEIHEGIVIFTAHGVSEDVYQKAHEKGLTIIDASCPFVVQTQEIVKEKLKQNHTIFYIGKNKHPEAEAIYSLSSSVYLIEKIDDIPSQIKGPVFVTNQTTMSILDIQPIFAEIQKQYPDVIIHDEICNATRVRQQALLDLKEQSVDALIVVGDPTSNNTRQLAEIGKKANIARVIRITDVSMLDINDLDDGMTVAITSGASTPTYLKDQVVYYLKHNDQPKPKIRIQELL